MVPRSWLVRALWLSISACGDGDSGRLQENGGEDASTPTDSGVAAAYVRGRVTDETGRAVGNVQVRSEKAVGRTDADGRFELRVDDMDDAKEVAVSVEDEKFSNGVVPVSVAKNADANVELTVKERKMVMLEDSKAGGRVQVDDGFAVEVPADALFTSAGVLAQGPVEIRYVLVNAAADVAAAPGRMQSSEKVALDGYGMVEVSFFKDGERLSLNKSATFEIPLVADSDAEEGKELPAYQLTSEDKRWEKGTGAMVKNGKVIVKSQHDGWVGAAKELPADSCVSGRLKASADSAAPHTTIRAARERGLSLVQAQTLADGSFCLPVSPNDDWRVSAYFADGKAESRGIQVALNSSDASGMCGGEGCKQVGDVELPVLAN